MRLLCLSLCLLFCNAIPSHAMNLAEVKNNLAAVEVLRARYQQTRYIAGLKPLESSGTLLLARNIGLVWSQEEPFRVRYVITDAAIQQLFPDQPANVRKKADNPELFKFVGLVSALLTQEDSAIEKTFAIDFAMHSVDTWDVSLTPRLEKIRKVFASIVLRGQQLVEDVKINETNGNKTSIHFSDLAASPPSLSPDEKLYFQN